VTFTAEALRNARIGATDVAKALCAVDGCVRSASRRGWCVAHYERWRNHGDPLLGGTPKGSLLAFVRRAATTDTDECILWPYPKNVHGYGVVRIGGKNRPAHRVVLELAAGLPPDTNMHAAHAPVICHTPSCVNPRHLRWATKVENAADRTADQHLLVGVRNPMAKLTDEQVLAIRDDWRRLADVAADYGVSRMTVSRIRRHELWAHVVAA
jgi:HNH endonuclease